MTTTCSHRRLQFPQIFFFRSSEAYAILSSSFFAHDCMRSQNLLQQLIMRDRFFLNSTTLLQLCTFCRSFCLALFECVKYTFCCCCTDADSPHLYSNHILNYLLRLCWRVLALPQDAHIGANRPFDSIRLRLMQCNSYQIFHELFRMESNACFLLCIFFCSTLLLSIVVVAIAANLFDCPQNGWESFISQCKPICRRVCLFTIFIINMIVYECNVDRSCLIPSGFFFSSSGLAFNCLFVTRDDHHQLSYSRMILLVSYRRHKRIFTMFLRLNAFQFETILFMAYKIHLGNHLPLTESNAVHKFCKCGKTRLFAVKKLIN